jgi:type 1 glutamine amidotransferase
MEAQQGPPGGRGAGRGGMSASVFTALDANGDGSLTRDEIKSTFEKWFAQADTARTGAITREQLTAALSGVFPEPPMPAAGRGQNQTPKPEDVAAMMAVMPGSAPARPLKQRRVLVLCKAQGFVHSSIPLAAKMVEAMGGKTGAWTTVITYDPADINADNLKQFDALFLDSTTGLFLDDPKDSGTTAARKAALLNFVRGGKGLAGIHAATDSYHGVPGATAAPAPAAGRGGPATMLAAAIAPQADQKLSRAALDSAADAWFDKLDPDKTGAVTQAAFAQRYRSLMPAPAGRGGPAAPQENAPLWPEFNKMIGGYFKFHWVYPQLITVKIDDPNSPLTAMFHGQEYQIHDETYTFAQDSFSRRNVHVLTSIDYSKMSDEDKAKEPPATRRTDGDYALSYIRREGQGRVFYEAHGHSETVYAIGPFVEHMLAGIQYALGDLKADDSPSVK